MLTPYNGGNLGDAAIQDALIGNIRLRLPGARFSGISLNCDNFVERHGGEAFPICAVNRTFYGMLSGTVAAQPRYGDRVQPAVTSDGALAALKRALKRRPAVWRCLKALHASGQELRHWAAGYRFLRTHDLLIVSGGGQLSDEGGGPWCHPFALFKWTLLARLAAIPCAVTSVGAGKITSRMSRWLLAGALRMAGYRSYRDAFTRTCAERLLPVASRDPIVPDLALSLPATEIPRPVAIRASVPVVAVSPICYAKPGRWPTLDQDGGLYQRYVEEMARVVSQLLARGCYVVIVWSSLWDDETAIRDVLERLDEEARSRLVSRARIACIASWQDLVASLIDADVLIASRLHSAILGYVCRRPTVAISFDAKVDRLMTDLGQRASLLRIADFTAEDVIEAVDSAYRRRTAIGEDVVAYLHRVAPSWRHQYDAVATLAAGRLARVTGSPATPSGVRAVEAPGA